MVLWSLSEREVSADPDTVFSVVKSNDNGGGGGGGAPGGVDADPTLSIETTSELDVSF